MRTLQGIHDEYMAALERREEAAMYRLVRGYGEIWKRLLTALNANMQRYERERAAGIESTPNVLFQDQRLRALLDQVEEEIGAWAKGGASAAEELQAIAAEVGLNESEEAMRAAFDVQLSGLKNPALRKSIQEFISITTLAKDALRDQIGYLGNGSPLSNLFDKIGPQIRKKWQDLLLQALARGWSPKRVAELARKNTGMGLARGLTIARTEMLRVYRTAHHRNFRNNSRVIGGWIWMSACDLRTCAACWAMHGTIHPLEEKLDDHPNGRCAPAPATRSWEEILGERGRGLTDTRPKIKTGEERFSALPEASQRKILGKKAFVLYQSGAVKLSDFAGFRHDAEWGRSLYERSAKEIVG